jgi:hypothetical protein
VTYRALSGDLPDLLAADTGALLGSGATATVVESTAGGMALRPISGQYLTTMGAATAWVSE